MTYFMILIVTLDIQFDECYRNIGKNLIKHLNFVSFSTIDNTFIIYSYFPFKM